MLFTLVVSVLTFTDDILEIINGEVVPGLVASLAVVFLRVFECVVCDSLVEA